MTTYEDLGIQPVINACGKMTLLGASILDERVADAMAQASRHYVNIMELKEKAGRRIAKITGAEAACVTCGASAGIAISTAAFMTGNDIGKIQMLPVETGEKNEIIIQLGHMINFAALARLSGAKLVPIGWVNLVVKEHLIHAINEKTAGFLYIVSHHAVQKSMLGLAECIAVCHEKQVPVLVDAAAEEDLQKYVKMGADLVTYSGGKAIEGPSFGFVCGKKEYIEACELQEWGIGRPMKVTKEGILGLLTALEIYAQTDQKEKREREARINESILESLQDLPYIQVEMENDEVRSDLVRTQIRMDEEKLGKTAFELTVFLRSGNPPIVTRDHKANLGIITIDPRTITLDQAKTIVKQIRLFFGK